MISKGTSGTLTSSIFNHISILTPIDADSIWSIEFSIPFFKILVCYKFAVIRDDCMIRFKDNGVVGSVICCKQSLTLNWKGGGGYSHIVFL